VEGRGKVLRERACKPGSVLPRWGRDGHFSGAKRCRMPLATDPGIPPGLVAGTGGTGHPDLSPYSVLLRAGLARPARRRAAGGLLGRRFSSTPRPGGAFSFLWRFPSRAALAARASALPSALPSEARTFLTARRRRGRPARSHSYYTIWPIPGAAQTSTCGRMAEAARWGTHHVERWPLITVPGFFTRTR